MHLHLTRILNDTILFNLLFLTYLTCIMSNELISQNMHTIFNSLHVLPPIGSFSEVICYAHISINAWSTKKKINTFASFCLIRSKSGTVLDF